MSHIVPITSKTCKAEMSVMIADFLTLSSNGRWTNEELLVAISDAADTALLDLTE